MSPRAPLLLFFAVTLAASTLPAAETPATATLDPAMAASKAGAAANLDWHDVTTWGVEGRAWPDQPRARWFDRLPAAAEKTVTPAVWRLSRDSAGMMARFRTNSTSLHVHYKLHSANLALVNMTAIGASGVDFYARDASGHWRWVQETKPDKQEMTIDVNSGLTPGEREYAVYLPLYNGVEMLEIGVTHGAKFEGLAPRTEKPLVFYGTSITQGASASRPGMAHPAILGRRFDMPVINLGFSGNGKMDEAVGAFLVQIDAAAYVIDCLPNMGPVLVKERTIPLVKQLRAARPDTPIVLVEDRPIANVWIMPERQKFHENNHAALRTAFETLQREGVKNLFYIPGDHLLGDDGEASTDGSHPSDLGFVRQADVMEPILRKALGK
jgi:hypothetical protein